MRKLLEFIRSVYVVVLFVVLEAIAISYYAHSTYYTQARLLARSNQLVGGVHGLFAGGAGGGAGARTVSCWRMSPG